MGRNVQSVCKYFENVVNDQIGQGDARIVILELLEKDYEFL